MSNKIINNEVLFRNNDQESYQKSILVWLLFMSLFIIIFRHTLLSRGRALTMADVIDSYAIIDIFAVLFAALVIFASGSLVHTWQTYRRSSVMWLSFYYGLGALSILWTLKPLFSFYRAVEYLILMWATLTAAAQYKDFETGEKIFCRLVVLIIFLEFGLIIRLQGFGWSWEHWHTNTYSLQSAILFCYCLGEYLAMSRKERSEKRDRAKRLRRYGTLSLLTLALGGSAGSNIAAAGGCLVIFLLLRNYLLLFVGSWLCLLVFLWVGDGWEVLRSILLPGKSDAALETGSGRFILWEYLWDKFLNQPVQGYGFGLAGFLSLGMASHTHNGYLTILIGTGLTGFAIFLVFSAKLWGQIIITGWQRKIGSLGCAGAMTAVFINNLSINAMADRWITSSIIFIWLLALFSLHVRKPRPSC